MIFTLALWVLSLKRGVFGSRNLSLFLSWSILNLTCDRKLITWPPSMGGREEVTLSSPRSKSSGAIYYFLMHKIKHLALFKSLCWIYTYENNCNLSGMLPEHSRRDPGPIGLVIWVYITCQRAWGWLRGWLWILRIFNFYKKKSSTARLRPWFQFNRDY